MFNKKTGYNRQLPKCCKQLNMLIAPARLPKMRSFILNLHLKTVKLRCDGGPCQYPFELSQKVSQSWFGTCLTFGTLLGTLTGSFQFKGILVMLKFSSNLLNFYIFWSTVVFWFRFCLGVQESIMMFNCW